MHVLICIPLMLLMSTTHSYLLKLPCHSLTDCLTPATCHLQRNRPYIPSCCSWEPRPRHAMPTHATGFRIDATLRPALTTRRHLNRGCTPLHASVGVCLLSSSACDATSCGSLPGMTPGVAGQQWYNAAACCKAWDLRTDSRVCRRLCTHATNNPRCVSNQPYSSLL